MFKRLACTLNPTAAAFATSRLSPGLLVVPRRHSSGSVQHVDTEENQATLPWDFTPASYKEIETILSNFPSNQRRSGLLPLLHLAQRQHGGWIPIQAMNRIASVLGIPEMRVYEVATFYSMYNREKVGKFHVQVCVTSMCMICGSDEVSAAIQKHLNIPMFGTTTDGMITLGEMECMGACANAPMVVVSDYSNAPKFQYRYYEDLTPESAVKIMDSLSKGEMPKWGSQIGRKNAMGPLGKTTLLEPPAGPFCRDLNPPTPAKTA